MSSDEPRIFLCHASLDKEFVRRLAKDLREHNVRVWLDEWELGVGDSLSKRIFEAIEQCDYLAAVISTNSVQSVWVEKELGTGLALEIEQRQVVVLPVLLEACPIPPALKDKVYADFTGSYNFGLGRLIWKISGGKPHSLLTTAELDLVQEIGDRGEFHTGMSGLRPGVDRLLNSLQQRDYVAMYGGSNLVYSLRKKGFEAYYSSFDYRLGASDEMPAAASDLRNDRAAVALLGFLSKKAMSNPGEPEFSVGDAAGVSIPLSEGVQRLATAQLLSVTTKGRMGPVRRYYLNRRGMLVANAFFGFAKETGGSS